MSIPKQAFPGFDAPAAGFEAPLEMLSACHGRVERQRHASDARPAGV